MSATTTPNAMNATNNYRHSTKGPQHYVPAYLLYKSENNGGQQKRRKHFGHAIYRNIATPSFV